MDIDVRKHETVQVIHLRGDLKLGDAVDNLRKTVGELHQGGEHRMVFNISEVPMIDSSGIGVLVRALTVCKQNSGSVKLVGPSKTALQALKIVGLTSLFEIYDDDNQAIASFS